MQWRFVKIWLVVFILVGCQKTDMATAPGSDEKEMVSQMLKFMEEQAQKNSEERKQNQKAMFAFMTKQNSENRKFLKSIIGQVGKNVKISPDIITDNTTDNSSNTTEDNSSSNTDTSNEEVANHFVEKSKLPEPEIGKWDPFTMHADPRSLPKVDLNKYPVFPNEDRGADPNVPAEQGGKGFGAWALKNGWTTNTSFMLVGDPKATKGGSITLDVPNYPATLRPIGKASNTTLNYFIRFCLWQTLLRQHPITKEWVPCLASHWKSVKENDLQTHYFRINPNAKWGDGSPVTADDVVASYRYYTHKDLGSPMAVETWSRLNPPNKISKYIVSISEKEHKWINFDRLGNDFYIFPSKILNSINPKDFNEQFNFYPMMGSGPYTIPRGSIIDDQSVELVRKKDWWGKNDRLWAGMFNFDRIKWITVLTRSLALQKALRGEIDVFHVTTSKLWVKEINGPSIQKGWLQKRMIFNHEPVGTQFIAMNQERAPFDQWEVRRAFSHLFPFEEISSKLMYDVYPKLTSYWPAGPYENIDNPIIGYDKDKAIELLAEAGYESRNSEGLLVNEDGEPLKVTLLYRSAGLKPHLEIFQNACEQVGIALTLKLQGSTLFNRAQQRDFQMVSSAWGASSVPTPDTSWKSTLKKGSNNFTGLKSEKIDGWIEEYEKQFDYQKRTKLIQKIDRELVEINPYILTWYAPFKRLIWWNKYSYPAGDLMRYEDEYYVAALWWYDEAKAKALEEAKENDTKLLAGGEKNKFWDKYRRWEHQIQAKGK